MQNYLGGRLSRAPEGTWGDFVIESGPNAGKTVDFMLTPDNSKQASKINQFFEKNLKGFTEQLHAHVDKADIVPMDTRFLSAQNNQLLLDVVRKLSPEQQAKILLVR